MKFFSCLWFLRVKFPWIVMTPGFFPVEVSVVLNKQQGKMIEPK